MIVDIPLGACSDDILKEKATLAMTLFHSVFSMELQLEQWGKELDFLGARLCNVRGPEPIKKKAPTWQTHLGSPHPPSGQRMISAIAPNAKQMITSYIPNEIKACAHYRMSTTTVAHNVQDVETLMERMK